MKPAEADLRVRRWFKKHGRAVEMTLARCKVPTPADRADLKQEVFITAFLALLRGVDILTPRAWLNACARKKASTYRRNESRRAPPAGEEEVVSTMASPAQIAEDREALCLAFACLDDEMREIVDMRAEGLAWEDIARESGITVARAKYLYTMAVTLMEAALKREDARTGKRRSVPFPIWLTQVFDAIRAEVDNAPPELDRRVRENLERFMEAAVAEGTDLENERVSAANPPPISIPITTPPTPPTTGGLVLGILGNGIAIGIFVACLPHGARLDKPSPEPNHARAIPVLALRESAEEIGESEAPAPLLPANESRMIPGKAVAQSHLSIKSASATVPVKVVSGSSALIDRARAVFRAGNESAALALLAQHAHRFPGEHDEERRELVKLVCAAPVVHGAAECADMVPSGAPK